MYKNTKKEDLINLLTELGFNVDKDTETVPQLRTKIENSQTYKDDPEMVSELLNSIVEDRKSRVRLEAQALEIQSQKIELEKIKLAQLEKQLEIEKTKNQNSKSDELSNISNENSNVNNVENLIKSVRTLTISVPEKSENLNLFFQTLERAFVLKRVPEELKSEILINLLAEKLNNILSYTNEEDLISYEKIKDLVLKENQPTALECLIKFRNARREARETHVQFSSRLNALFRYYLKLRDVHDFETLIDLIVYDKLFQSLDRETASYISVKQGSSWLNSKLCAKECDIFFVNRGKSLTEAYTNTPTREKFFENKNVTKFAKDSLPRKPPFKNNKEKQISCYVCSQSHYARDCPNRNSKAETSRKENLRTFPSNSIYGDFNENVPKNLLTGTLDFVDLFVDDIPIKCLKDSGSSLFIVNKKLITRPKTKISQINLISCFNETKSADLCEFKISLPGCKAIFMTGALSDDLSCDAIVPFDVYEELKKKSNNELFFPDTKAHRSAEDKQSFFSLPNENNSDINSFFSNMCNLIEETEYDLSHLSDKALKEKLDELIKKYKPYKTRDTNLKMSIILTDDVPVCVRRSRISLIEKKQVEKQIDQWLKDGVISESVSDYCSPIVVCRKKMETFGYAWISDN